MPITKIASSSLEENQQNYINILRAGQSVIDTGWTTYSDSAGVNPVDGIGGTATVTWSQNTSNPLSGDADLRLVKDASNRQGDGVSIPFTIANRHLAKVLQITFDMELISGTYSTGDLRVSVIQDPSGTPVLLEPVGTSLELGIANQRMREIATFQTHVSVTSYRLCIHVSSTSASAYTVDFANFKVWEQQQSLGAVITDWQSYTPTINGITSSSSSFQWRRTGGSVEITGSFTFSSSVSGTFQLPLPSGLSISSTITRKTLFGKLHLGRATADGSNPQWFLIGNGGNSFLTLTLQSSNNTSTLTDFNSASTGAVSGDIFTLFASVPIAGWGSNVAMSSDTGDGRVVSAIYKNLVGSLNTQYGFQWNSRVIDTHNAVSQTGSSPNARTVFTAPVNGFYQVSAFVLCSNSGYVDIYKNDSIYARISGTENTTYGDSISFTISLNAGENFYIRTMNMTSTSTSTSDGQFSVFRISAGSQVIASSETVACSYIRTSTATVNALQRIEFNQRLFDSHGAVTTGSVGSNNWKFTAPMSGKYSLSGQIIGSTGQIHLYKNNSVFIHSYTYVDSTGVASIDGVVDLLSGEWIDLRPNINNSVNGNTLSASAYISRIEIFRIGL